MDTGIIYLKGDATAPSSKGAKIIAHICNAMAVGVQVLCLPYQKDGKNRKTSIASGIGTKIIFSLARYALCRLSHMFMSPT